MHNQLKDSTSPYLLQHAENPVNWYPWCEEAFARAKAENKPIFLSIGYSTCHWCHVMAHESFENETTARILNKHFISIKVDREERPDIDSVYMAVCQAFTGSGGWPMSIFMTWDKKPFFAGTYFPIRSHNGIPGFSDLLETIASLWHSRNTELLKTAEEIISHLKNTEASNTDTNHTSLTENAIQFFRRSFDPVHGGFGQAPKFPTPHNLLFLMLYAKQNPRSNAIQMAEKTLLQMRKGGIFDHIGGGFARYSTDKYFLAPHFEKMLYDNALLIMAYAAAYSMTKNPVYLDTAKQTADYILREMTSPEGGFYSAQDADSEGVEGKFYTFSPDEILKVLGEEQGKQFATTFDITPEGNFEHTNIPNLLRSGNFLLDFSDAKQKLRHYRKQRMKLHLDDKILLSWNAVMITAMAMLYRISHEEKHLHSAQRAQTFLAQNLCQSLQLSTSFRDGKRSAQAFLDDYAFYIAALIELYNSTLDCAYLNKAKQLCNEAVRRFADAENGGFYLCESDHAELFLNPKETYDGAIPSGNSVMAYNFVRLYQLTEEEAYQSLAEKQFAFLSAQADGHPAGHSLFLLAKHLYDDPPMHITIVSEKTPDLTEFRTKLPFLANISIVRGNEKYRIINGKTTYYICRDHVCLPPVNTPELTEK